MKLIGNALNGEYMANLLTLVDSDDLRRIVAAVAYVRGMDELFGKHSANPS